MAKTTKYEEKYIKANRTFPTANTVLLVIVVCIQIGLILLAIFYQPTPQDLIHEYQVTVDPLEDGSLDIEYRFVWEALDTSEELTWVQKNGVWMTAIYHPSALLRDVSKRPETFDDLLSIRAKIKEVGAKV